MRPRDRGRCGGSKDDILHSLLALILVQALVRGQEWLVVAVAVAAGRAAAFELLCGAAVEVHGDVDEERAGEEARGRVEVEEEVLDDAAGDDRKGRREAFENIVGVPEREREREARS